VESVQRDNTRLLGPLQKAVAQQVDKGDGTTAATYKDNAFIVANNHQKLFNCNCVDPDFTILKEIKPLPIPQGVKDEIASPPPTMESSMRLKSLNQVHPQVSQASPSTCSKNYRTKGTYLFLFHLLYADDSTFFFETLDELMYGSQTTLDHYTHFGLIMHT
jgi:hypothetical protein